MSALRPLAFYGLKVPANGLRIEGNPGLPASFQITMAAIDPTEEVTSSGPRRATLKIVRNIFDVVDEDDEEDYDEDDVEAIRRRLGFTESDEEDESEDDEDDELVNGGPSDPEKVRKAQEKAMLKALKEDEDDIDMEDIANGINGKSKKGKGRALDIEDIDDDESISEDGLAEYVVCTLDPENHYQQPINITIGEEEECYFRVVGSHTIHLTGNFVAGPESIADGSDDESDEEAEYDDDDESDVSDETFERLLKAYGQEGEGDSEEDELDDLEDPRVTEVDSEEEAPKLTKADKKKNKKRAAEEDATVDPLDKAIADEEKRQSKKLKNNEGKPIAAEKEAAKPSKKEEKKDKKVKKDEAKETNGKKVQFAEKLEQGPTPSKAAAPAKKVVNGVTIEDKKAGSGPGAKKGDRIGMRYIGKLKNGQVFDSNKKGKPFEFKLGSGEVIKGWDVGVAGLTVGGERRITVPAKLAYGNKALPGIPANSELIFDLKLISIN